jgi:hypothetical protein
MCIVNDTMQCSIVNACPPVDTQIENAFCLQPAAKLPPKAYNPFVDPPSLPPMHHTPADFIEYGYKMASGLTHLMDIDT